MSNKTKITADEWISEAFKNLPEKPENAFTINEVVQKTGQHGRTVISRLERLITLGKLKKGRCMIDGRPSNYYIPVELLDNENRSNDGRTIAGTKNIIGKTTRPGNQRAGKKNSKKPLQKRTKK
jgi:hypothetical protein